MKLAEQVAKNLILPSVNELRYAGRRVIEASSLEDRPENLEHLSALIRDARFFCHRARHDAIDASIAQIVADIENLMQTLGAAIILQCFHDFAALRSAIRKVQRNIVASRKDRENRDLIYRTVSECDFPFLVELYNELMQSEALMLEVAAGFRKDHQRNNVFGYGGLVIGVLGFLTAILAWTYPHLLGAR